MADKFIVFTKLSTTQWKADGKMLDSRTQKITRFDFSGANALTLDLANVALLFNRLTTAQKDELARQILDFVIDVLTPAGA
jgi:mannose/fructose/N-acetylgalactosamine-specific phosphotransferase system component IIC